MKKSKIGLHSYKCEFCSINCKKINEYQACSISVWFCEACSVRSIVDNANLFLLDRRFYIKFKNKKYCAKFTYDDLCLLDRPKKFELLEVLNQESVFLSEPIIALDYHPDITPSSLKERLHLLLAFL